MSYLTCPDLTKPFKGFLGPFDQYKIDYRKCLGSGNQGSVYSLVKRPPEEVGIFSSVFPYIYDRIYPVSGNQLPSTDRCIKILNNPCFFLSYCCSKENKSNEVAFQHGLTSVEFYKTNSLISQIKKEIKGDTFSGYMYHFQDTDRIYDKGFELRRAFFHFLKKIESPNLVFSDLHAKNIMYNENTKNWEIVDGNVKERDITKMDQQDLEKISSQNITRFIDELFNSNVDQRRSVLAMLIACEISDCLNFSSYNKDTDADVCSRAQQKNRRF